MVTILDYFFSVAVINHYAERYWDPKKRVRQKGMLH